jgi:tetratricopeptide (TPR) repeat protein
MTGISSRSAGVVLVPKPGTKEYAVFDIVEGVQKEPFEAQFLYSAAQDWEEIEGNDATALLETATREYWLARTVSHLRMAIGGLEASLEVRVFESTEEILGSRVTSEDVLNRLLVAPLADPLSPVALAKSALSHGFSVVASVLDELVELQPLLRRLTDHWLGLPEELFSDMPESKEKIWLTLVEKHRLSDLLKSDNGDDFENKWNLLAFSFTESERTPTGVQTDEAEPWRGYVEQRGGSDPEALESVKKQILAVAKKVSEGSDIKAEKFLRQLIKKQTSVSAGEDYAVKSLCNIAQLCADMFRTDFEIICLNKAMELKPSDAWTLIQRGDHLKRVGKYEEALEVLEQAQHSGERDVAISCMADVYSEQSEHEEAIRIYKTIPDWSNKAAVLTAIADNLRRIGNMDESQAAYSILINRAQQGLPGYDTCEARAQAGLAEIAKRQGRFDEALRIYREILPQEQEEDRDKVIYRLGLCNVLKLMEKYDDAYRIVDDVIVKYPFAMQARFIRGSILGLIGDERHGLDDLPEGKGSRSGQEWSRRYYRGLLLFKLKRYDDAKKDLVDELPKAIASGEGKAILRLGAALWFLWERKIPEADGVLSDIPDLYDCHMRYLSLVLKLYSATQKEDRDTIASLRKQIANLGMVDAKLDDAVTAIGKRDFSLAITYVTDALLKLAA